MPWSLQFTVFVRNHNESHQSIAKNTFVVLMVAHGHYLNMRPHFFQVTPCHIAYFAAGPESANGDMWGILIFRKSAVDKAEGVIYCPH